MNANDERDGNEKPWRMPWWGWLLVGLHVPPACALLWLLLRELLG